MLKANKGTPLQKHERKAARARQEPQKKSKCKKKRPVGKEENEDSSPRARWGSWELMPIQDE